jgi:hypothetical protein
MKEKKIKQTGITIQEIALLNLWGGGQGEIMMDEKYIPNDKISKENILRCINDGQFGCKSIEWADVDIYINYENGFALEYNRTIRVENKNYQQFYCRGIK